MAKYTALRQATGDYGTVLPGDVVEITNPKVAEDLEARGIFAKGSKEVTDTVLQKAADQVATSEQSEGDEVMRKAQENAPPSGATQLDPNAVKEAEKKASGPAENKSATPAKSK